MKFSEKLAVPIYAGCGLSLAYLANGSPINLGFGLDLLPSPILSYFALRAFGPLVGMTTAFGGAIRTIDLWGHPWAACEMIMQPLFLLWCWKRSRLQGLASLLVYWPLLGAPFILFTYGVLLGYDTVSLETVALKQALNSLSGYVIGNVACFILATLSPAKFPYVSRHGFAIGALTAWLLVLCTAIPSFVHLNYNARFEEAAFETSANESIRRARARYGEVIAALIEESRRAVKEGRVSVTGTRRATDYLLLTYQSGPEKGMRSAFLKSMTQPESGSSFAVEDAMYLFDGEVVLDKNSEHFLIAFGEKNKPLSEIPDEPVLRQTIVVKLPLADLLEELDGSYDRFLRQFIPANPATGDPNPNILASSRQLCAISGAQTQITPQGEEGLYKLGPLPNLHTSPMQIWLNSCYFGIIQVSRDLFFLFGTRRDEQILAYRINARNLMRLDAFIIFVASFFGTLVSHLAKYKIDAFTARLIAASSRSVPGQKSKRSVIEEFRVLERGLEELMLTLQLQRGKTREVIKHLNSLLYSAPSVIYGASITENDICINFCSPSLSNVLRIPANDFKDIAIWQGRIVPDDRHYRLSLIASASLNGKADAEYRIADQDGSVRWIHEHLRRDTSSQSSTSYVGQLQDVTTRKEAELRMIQSSKMLTLGEMATGMAHELNQPLNIVSLTADNALFSVSGLREAIRTPGHKDHVQQLVALDDIKFRLERVIKQTERAGKLIHHMRIFGRTAGTSHEAIDPIHLIEEATSLLEQQLRLKDIKIKKVYGTTLPPANGQPQLLEQVIVNLLLNSRDAILAKRAVSSDPAGESDMVEISIQKIEGRLPLSIAIRDTGGGIPSHIMDKIFQPFFTTKPPGMGTGLGLSICYGIITEMGGQILAHNEGGGAVFTILLPAS